MTSKVKVHPNRDEYISRDNPYIVLSTDEMFIQQIPDALIQKAMRIEQMNCSVKCICLIDIIFSTYYFMYNVLLGFLCTMLSVGGYMSTIYYKKSLMCGYVIYQYLQVVGRVFNLIYFATPENTRDVQNGTVTEDFYVDGIIFMSIMTLCQIIITAFIHKYYYLLPTEHEKRQIQAIGREGFL